MPPARVLAAGDLFLSDPLTPLRIDYAAGGSAKEYTKTLDAVLQLDFDAVVPGHGAVATRQEVRKYQESAVLLRNRVHKMIQQKRTREEIARMQETEFRWTGIARQVLMIDMFDGLIGEMQ